MQTLKGVIVLIVISLNVVFWFIPIFVLGLVKLLLPIPALQRLLSRMLMGCGENWITVNKFIQNLTQGTRFTITGRDTLRRHDWYLVISNHQTWVDIVVLQYVFNRRIPFLKFFIKDVLKWIPFLGLAWWAMDMPFMKRFSKSYLAKYPEKRGQDLEATRRSCEKFREVPTSVINFVEGTRFTPEKHAKADGPFTHLLPPRAGGISFALSVMGERFRSMLDVTIVYPGGSPSIWGLMTGKIRNVVVDVREIPVEDWMSRGDYLNDPTFRERFQHWLTELWHAKDQRFAALVAQHASVTR